MVSVLIAGNSGSANEERLRIELDDRLSRQRACASLRKQSRVECIRKRIQRLAPQTKTAPRVLADPFHWRSLGSRTLIEWEQCLQLDCEWLHPKQTLLHLTLHRGEGVLLFVEYLPCSYGLTYGNARVRVNDQTRCRVGCDRVIRCVIIETEWFFSASVEVQVSHLS
jgi:hypothetical protein